MIEIRTILKAIFLSRKQLARSAIVDALHGFMQAFARQGELEWEETHFRLARLPSDADVIDWVYRNGGRLYLVPATPNARQKEDCRKLLGQWMAELLDEMGETGSRAPVVAVVNVTARKKARFQFATDDTDALQVGLAYLGQRNSCFGAEVEGG